MKLKRILLTALVLPLTLCALFVTASAATIVDSGKRGDNLTWTLDSEGTLTFSGTGEITAKSSGAYSPWEAYPVTKLVIESGITSIGANVFSGSSVNLVEVSLPNTLTYIGDFAFAYQPFEEIVIPNSVTSIGQDAFTGCLNLKEIRLSNRLKKISSSMFQSCVSLERIVIPESVTSIERYAFSNCFKLQTIEFPSNLKTIEEFAFWDCTALGFLIVPDTVSVIEDCAFMSCTSLTTAYLPASLSVIGTNLFYDCSSLEKVFLPLNLHTICGGAFAGCNSLTEVYFPGTKEQLAKIQIQDGNDPLYYADIYLVLLITKEPEDAYVYDGDTVKFSTDTGKSGVNYQWYYLAPGADEWKPCKQSGAKTKTLTFTATEKENGYYYCCEVTDSHGRVGTTRAALLTIVKPVTITAQPQSAEVAAGALAQVTVKATGDGLTYQWYIKNVGKTKFSKSSVTSNTYSVKMSSAVDGRQIYCVVTDKYGNRVTSETVTLTMGKGVSIVTQPTTTYTKQGATASVAVKATGEGLTYQWYIKNAGASKFSKSSVTKATYTTTMSSKAKDRQIYCVVTDQYGNSVKSNTVYLRMAATVTAQPKTTYTKQGSTVKASLAAAGDGLTYQWYIKNAGASKFSKSSVTAATYTVTMSSKAKDRQIYCIVTDQYGNSVKSNTVYLRMAATITTQPKTTYAAQGSTAKVSLAAAGDGLTYQWYSKNASATKFSKSSVTAATYSTTMRDAVNGRQLYCVVTDKYGNTVKTNTVTIKMK